MDLPEQPKVTAADFFSSSRPNSSLSQRSSTSRPSTTSRHARLLASYAISPTAQTTQLSNHTDPLPPTSKPLPQDKSLSLLDSLGISGPSASSSMEHETSRVARPRSTRNIVPLSHAEPSPSQTTPPSSPLHRLMNIDDNDEEYDMLLPPSLRRNKIRTQIDTESTDLSMNRVGPTISSLSGNNPVRAPVTQLSSTSRPLSSPQSSLSSLASGKYTPYSLDAANDIDEEYLQTLLHDIDVATSVKTYMGKEEEDLGREIEEAAEGTVTGMSTGTLTGMSGGKGVGMRGKQSGDGNGSITGRRNDGSGSAASGNGRASGAGDIKAVGIKAVGKTTIGSHSSSSNSSASTSSSISTSSSSTSALPRALAADIDMSVSALNERLLALQVPVVSEYANLQRARGAVQRKRDKETGEKVKEEKTGNVYRNGDGKISSIPSRGIPGKRSVNDGQSNGDVKNDFGLNDNIARMLDIEEVRNWREGLGKRLESILSEIDQANIMDRSLSKLALSSSNDADNNEKHTTTTTSSGMFEDSRKNFDFPLKNVPLDARSARGRESARANPNTNNNVDTPANIDIARAACTDAGSYVGSSSSISSGSSSTSSAVTSRVPARVVGSVRITADKHHDDNTFNSTTTNTSVRPTVTSNVDNNNKSSHSHIPLKTSTIVSNIQHLQPISTPDVNVNTTSSTMDYTSQQNVNSRYNTTAKETNKLLSLLNATQTTGDITVHQALALAAAVEGDDGNEPVTTSYELLGIDYGLGTLDLGLHDGDIGMTNDGNWRTILDEDAGNDDNSDGKNRRTDNKDILQMVEDMEKESVGMLASGQSIISRILEGVDLDDDDKESTSTTTSPPAFASPPAITQVVASAPNSARSLNKHGK